MISTTTKRDRIQSVPSSYDRQYRDRYGEAFLVAGRDPYDTYQRLRKLNLATCSESDVAEAIGNGSWTETKCDHCENDTELLVNIEGPFDSMSLCRHCVAAAASAIEARSGETAKTGSTEGESAASEAGDAQS